MTRFLLPLTVGFLIDLAIGDPYFLPHPVCAMGWFIKKMETFLRRKIKDEKIGGTMVVLSTVTTFTLIPFVILYISYRLNFVLGLFIESIMCWQCLAMKGLKKESMKVYKALKNQGLEDGRKAVSMIVGRDTSQLSVEGVTKAAVETVAENTSDGVIAPIFYMALGGGVLGYCYKAINTMDSMLGYKNEKYINFGTTAAKLDDLANFIPSRISGVLMVLAAYIIGLDGKNAWKVFKRDRLNHASPNSAQTEAACAGALRIRLAGDAWYFGKLYKKKTIGDDLRPVDIEDIYLANKLLYAASFLMILLLSLLWLF